MVFTVMSAVRAFISRLFLDISCDRDSVMDGSAMDFWRLHPEITDTDTLLDMATEKLELVVKSSVRDLPEFNTIIRCYVHDMFPYYLESHVERVRDFVLKTCSFTPLHCTRENPGNCESPEFSPSMTPCRPPKPMSFGEATSFSMVANTEYVDTAGNIYMTDKVAQIRWFGVKMGGSVRWKLCRNKIEFVGASPVPVRGLASLRVHERVVEKVWVGRDKVGSVEIWPGIPRFDDPREIDSIEAGTSLASEKSPTLSFPVSPLQHSRLTLSIQGKELVPGECVSVTVVRVIDLVRAGTF